MEFDELNKLESRGYRKREIPPGLLSNTEKSLFNVYKYNILGAEYSAIIIVYQPKPEFSFPFASKIECIHTRIEKYRDPILYGEFDLDSEPLNEDGKKIKELMSSFL